MSQFACPYLHSDVELSEDRRLHILATHPEFGPDVLTRIGQTLQDPDRVQRSRRMANARLFCKWYDDLAGGKHAVVVVVSDQIATDRSWIITAYVAGKLSKGIVEWTKN